VLGAWGLQVHINPDIEAALVSLLDHRRSQAEVLVTSFDHFAVRRVKQLDPSVRTAVMYAGRPLDPVGLARAAGADAVRPDHYTLTAEDVSVCHAAGPAVIPWTSQRPRTHWSYARTSPRHNPIRV
jgi:glycerophosphoryl diester phosphodiesterase